jgi:hypothetical protein
VRLPEKSPVFHRQSNGGAPDKQRKKKHFFCSGGRVRLPEKSPVFHRQSNGAAPDKQRKKNTSFVALLFRTGIRSGTLRTLFPLV